MTRQEAIQLILHENGYEQPEIHFFDDVLGRPAFSLSEYEALDSKTFSQLRKHVKDIVTVNTFFNVNGQYYIVKG